MKHNILLLLLLIFSYSLSNAQLLKRKQIPFEVNNKLVKNALAGGINNAQISQGDINMDGEDDIFIFDRTGNVILIYLYNPITTKYEIDYELKKNFPRLRNWAYILDFNKDGIVDIFSSSSETQGPHGIEIHQGYKVDDHVEFEIRTFNQPYNIIYYPAGNQFANLIVNSLDLATYDDIDRDGDIDIITFSPGSTKVEWYKNIAVERNWSLDSLSFVRQDECYGKFIEGGLNSEITLSTNANVCAMFQNSSNEKRHSGSTLLSIDLDGNNLQDLLIGDLSADNIIAVFNNGTTENAWMTSQDTHWNSEDISAKLFNFNAAFSADIDHDGLKDIIITPNARNVSENVNQIWHYKNIGTTKIPKFELNEKDLFVGDMLDFGSSVHPVFVDYNQDGLLDLMIGTEGVINSTRKKYPSLVLFKNTGTKSVPKFTLIDSNYLDMRRYGLLNTPSGSYAPAFGDLDSDGDLDMLVGDYKGAMFYYENIAGPNKEFEFKSPLYEYQDLFIGLYAVPAIVDLDRDGLMDIVVGSRDMNNTTNFELCSSLTFFKNQGTKTKAFFDSDQTKFPNTQCLGKAILQGEGSKVYASPIVLDLNGKYKLFTGTIFGETSLYVDIEKNIYGKFTRENPNYGQMTEGSQTHLAIADIDNDGILDMCIGNLRGGISFFETDIQVDGNYVNSNFYEFNAVQLYPNPSRDIIHIKSNQIPINRIKIYDINGKKIIENHIINDNTTLDISQLPQGIYNAILQIDNKTIYRKFIKS